MAGYEPSLTTGKQLHKWIESADGDCPVRPCTLVIDEFQHQISQGAAVVRAKYPDPGPYDRTWSHVERMCHIFNVPLQRSEGAEWTPAYYVKKWDDWRYQFPADRREERMKEFELTFPGEVVPEDMKMFQSWTGVVSKNCAILNFIKHNYDQPYISEVTNAIYTHLMSEHELRYVFVVQVENPQTREFITKVLLTPQNGWKYPPDKDTRYTFDTSEEKKDHYFALLGTVIGKTVANLVLGRYPRGTCKIPSIEIGISGIEDGSDPFINMMFVLEATKPAHGLRKAVGAAATPAPKPMPPPGGEKAPGDGIPGAEEPPAPDEIPLAVAMLAPTLLPPIGGKPLQPKFAAGGLQGTEDRGGIMKRNAEDMVEEIEKQYKRGATRSTPSLLIPTPRWRRPTLKRWSRPRDGE